jgi:tripartite-type tricarboxylate transporter receptor subunit TctC
LAFSSIAGALPFTKGNKVLPLATTGERRSSVYPDLPTVREAGTDFTVDLWLTLFAPTGLPSDVLTKLNEAANIALKNPSLVADLDKVGVEPRGSTPQEGAAFIKTEYTKWKQVIESANIKLN